MNIHERAEKFVQDFTQQTYGKPITLVFTRLGILVVELLKEVEQEAAVPREALAELGETLAHDAACWRSIAERADASDYIREFAQIRSNALNIEIDAIVPLLKKDRP